MRSQTSQSPEYQRTRVLNPDVFEESGHAYDLRNIKYVPDSSIEKVFEDIKQAVIKNRKVERRILRIALAIGGACSLLCAIYFISRGEFDGLFACIRAFIFPFIISFFVVALTYKSKDYTPQLKARYYDMCIEPLLQQLDSGADANDDLPYFPIFGFMECNGQTYDVGLKRFGSWLYDVGVLKRFRDNIEVSGSFNTLNANREGFFLVNLLTETHQNKHAHTVFKGPVICVRLHNAVDGWVALHTNAQGFCQYTLNATSGNPNFDAAFKCTAQTLEDLQAFFKPRLTDGLVQIREHNKSRQFGVYVQGDFCIIAINNGTHYFLEPTSVKSAEDMSLEGYWDELMNMLQWVYYLRDILDRR